MTCTDPTLGGAPIPSRHCAEDDDPTGRYCRKCSAELTRTEVEDSSSAAVGGMCGACQVAAEDRMDWFREEGF